MDPELQRVKLIFERAIDLEPGAREDYLAATCAEEPILREKVERLLREHDKKGDLLDTGGRHQRGWKPSDPHRPYD